MDASPYPQPSRQLAQKRRALAVMDEAAPAKSG